MIALKLGVNLILVFKLSLKIGKTPFVSNDFVSLIPLSLPRSYTPVFHVLSELLHVLGFC